MRIRRVFGSAAMECQMAYQKQGYLCTLHIIYIYIPTRSIGVLIIICFCAGILDTHSIPSIIQLIIIFDEANQG